MRSRIARVAVGAVGSSALALGLLIGATPATQAADGTLAFIPESGKGDTAFSVLTSGGCASAQATHFIIKMTGSGLREEVNITGVTDLTAIGASPSQTTPMTAPVSKVLDTVKEENGGRLPNGSYTVTFTCRPKMTTTALRSFTGTITVTNVSGGGLTWTSGRPPAPEPVVNTAKPTIKGTAAVGRTLRATTGRWTPTPDSYAYSWKLGKKVVSKKARIKVTAAMKGKRLTVTVVAKKSGYANGRAVARVRVR